MDDNNNDDDILSDDDEVPNVDHPAFLLQLLLHRATHLRLTSDAWPASSDGSRRRRLFARRRRRNSRNSNHQQYIIDHDQFGALSRTAGAVAGPGARRLGAELGLCRKDAASAARGTGVHLQHDGVAAVGGAAPPKETTTKTSTTEEENAAAAAADPLLIRTDDADGSPAAILCRTDPRQVFTLLSGRAVGLAGRAPTTEGAAETTARSDDRRGRVTTAGGGGCGSRCCCCCCGK